MIHQRRNNEENNLFEPPLMRTIFVGDIHGCLDELRLLLKKCEFHREHDRLILVGDLINKGPKSVEVLKYVRENKIEFVLGNHELKLIEIMKLGTKDIHRGTQLNELALELAEDEFDWLTWLSNHPLYIIEDDYMVVHAGVVPGRKVEETAPEILANIRTWDGVGENMNSPSDPAWHELYKEDRVIVYGHWATAGLSVASNTIGLDSGCCYGGHLSALILPSRDIVQVKALSTYVSIK